MTATLDGIVEGSGAVFEATFMLHRSFDEGAAAEQHMAQVQHKMWVTHAKSAVLSIITGDGKWVEIAIPQDPLYLTILVSAEKKFWHCVRSGQAPHLVHAEPPRRRIEAVRIVDMSSSKTWLEFAHLYRATHDLFLTHERAKRELAALMPAHAEQVIGHGVCARRTTCGALRFELLQSAVRYDQ